MSSGLSRLQLETDGLRYIGLFSIKKWEFSRLEGLITNTINVHYGKCRIQRFWSVTHTRDWMSGHLQLYQSATPNHLSFNKSGLGVSYCLKQRSLSISGSCSRVGVERSVRSTGGLVRRQQWCGHCTGLSWWRGSWAGRRSTSQPSPMVTSFG